MRAGSKCDEIEVVARIWRKWEIQPHRIETFKVSTDPQLEAKIRDVADPSEPVGECGRRQRG